MPIPPAKIQVSINTTHGVNGENADGGWTDEEWDDDDDDEPVVFFLSVICCELCT